MILKFSNVTMIDLASSWSDEAEELLQQSPPRKMLKENNSQLSFRGLTEIQESITEMMLEEESTDNDDIIIVD